MIKVDRTIRVVMALIALLSLGQPLFAAQNYYGFDEKIEYDIYFYSGESFTSVLENVTILGFQQIGGKDFLIVRSKGFKLSEEAGYILFDSIIAILPDRNFKVGKTDAIQFRQSQ